MILKMLLLCGVLLFCCGFFMPVRRTVDYSDQSGKSWREGGTMPVSIVTAQQAWELALTRDGWRLVKTIPLDVMAHKHLEVWEKNTVTLMLCLWSLSTGSSGYMWGIIQPNNK